MLTINNPNKFDWANMPLTDCLRGNALDSYFTLKLFDLIEEKLEGSPVLDFYEKVMSPLSCVFSDMEWEGMLVSEERLSTIGKELGDLVMDQEDSLYYFPGVSSSDNISSTKDLIDILYLREGGFEFYPPDKTAKGTPSVSAPTIKVLLEQIDEELVRRNE
jgi:DNA polymerase I-like protein with 3'-5' exonuclease and polymerase domains